MGRRMCARLLRRTRPRPTARPAPGGKPRWTRARRWRTRAGAARPAQCRPAAVGRPAPAAADSSRRSCSRPPSRRPRASSCWSTASSDDVSAPLDELKGFYASRGVNLVKVADKWMFCTAEDLAYLLERHAKEQRWLSKVALETLAIVADHGAGDARGDRGDPRRVGVGGHARRADGDRLGAPARLRALGEPVTYGTTEEFWRTSAGSSIKRSAGPRRKLAEALACRRATCARLYGARAHRLRRAPARRAPAARHRRGGWGVGAGQGSATEGSDPRGLTLKC